MAKHTLIHYSATERQQDEAYDQGYRAFDASKAYDNPYDSDRRWLLYMAFEQGWNDAIDWHRSRNRLTTKSN
jgi:beta-xylosidase